MAASFSPGPWSVADIVFEERIPIRGGKTAFGRPYNIALVNRPGSARAGEDVANARLIAAAPELLDTLTLIREYVAMSTAPSPSTVMDWCDIAIRKALPTAQPGTDASHETASEHKDLAPLSRTGEE